VTQKESGTIQGLSPLQEVTSQLGNLEQARVNPHIHDDYTVGRVLKVYGDQQEFVGIFAEQVGRWRREGHPTPTQKKDLDKLAGQIEQWGRAVDLILARGEELRKTQGNLGKSEGLESCKPLAGLSGIYQAGYCECSPLSVGRQRMPSLCLKGRGPSTRKCPFRISYLRI
jgi:hypothetical protein